MSEIKAQLPPQNLPFIDENGCISKTWWPLINGLWLRTGGFKDFGSILELLSLTNVGQLSAVLAQIEGLGTQVAAVNLAVQSRRNYEDRLEALASEVAGLRLSVSAFRSNIDQIEDLRIAFSQAQQSIQFLSAQNTTLRAENDRIQRGAEMAAVQYQTYAAFLRLQQSEELAIVTSEISALTTDNVAEGARLYYTDARARSSLAAGGSLLYNPATGVFSIVVGSAAYQNIGTSGANVPLLSTANIWTAAQVFTVGTSSSNYNVGSNQVVGPRQTGWASWTGTADRATHATYTAPVISASPTQAEVQAIANSLQQVSRGLKAVIDDLTTHGLIGV